jgi:putative Mn2+ efflux pump MntP
MNLLEIIIIAIGLSMDAFAVSITLGLSVKKALLAHLRHGVSDGILF